MKREVNIEKIGRKMPYKAPSEAFFENFKEQMIEKIAQEQIPQRKVVNMRLLIPVIAVAASLIIGLFIIDGVEHNAQDSFEYQFVSDNIDASIDSYFNNLSDDELAYLVDNSSSQDSFYLTLPTNE